MGGTATEIGALGLRDLYGLISHVSEKGLIVIGGAYLDVTCELSNPSRADSLGRMHLNYRVEGYLVNPHDGKGRPKWFESVNDHGVGKFQELGEIVRQGMHAFEYFGDAFLDKINFIYTPAMEYGGLIVQPFNRHLVPRGSWKQREGMVREVLEGIDPVKELGGVKGSSSSRSIAIYPASNI